MTPLEPFEVVGFKGDFAVEPALLKTCNADEILLLFTRLAAFLAVAFVNIVLGLRVGRDNAFEVSENGLSRGLADDVIRHYGSLAAAAGSIHNEGGDAVAAGVAAQTFDYLDALAYRGAEVAESHGKVTYIDVVGTDTDLNEALNKLLHYMYAIVYARKQYALVAKGDTCIGKHLTGTLTLFGDLVGMIEVGVEPNGMVLLEHCAKLGCDPLRTDDGGAGADAYDFNMGHLAKLADDVFKPVIVLHESVAAGEQDIANLGMVADILEAGIDLLGGNGGVMLACEPSAGAVAAVHGALVGDEQQHTVGIAVSQAGGGRVGILMQGIGVLIVGILQLLGAGNGHLADGIEGIVQIDQGQIIRSHCHAQLAQGLGNAGFLIGSQGHITLQILNSLSAVGNLPMPVVPKIFGNIGEQTIASLHIRISFLFFLIHFTGNVHIYGNRIRAGQGVCGVIQKQHHGVLLIEIAHGLCVGINDIPLHPAAAGFQHLKLPVQGVVPVRLYGQINLAAHTLSTCGGKGTRNGFFLGSNCMQCE